GDRGRADRLDARVGLERRDDRRAPRRLAAVEPRQRALHEPELLELGEALPDLREERPGGDRADHHVGRLPAELLGDLERERLRALGVVRAEVEVYDSPRLPE